MCIWVAIWAALLCVERCAARDCSHGRVHHLAVSTICLFLVIVFCPSRRHSAAKVQLKLTLIAFYITLLLIVCVCVLQSLGIQNLHGTVEANNYLPHDAGCSCACRFTLYLHMLLPTACRQLPCCWRWRACHAGSLAVICVITRLCGVTGCIGYISVLQQTGQLLRLLA